MKWVDLRPEIDSLTGAVRTDPRTSGASPADRAALEWALRLGSAWDAEVVAVTAGVPAAEAMLREAVAAGASAAIRVELADGATSESTAAALAPVVAGADVAVCGDWSVDRGSGSVPAFLAAHRGAAQALGCTRLEPGAPGCIDAERRLDGGRRELVRLRAPAVVSVEAAGTRLRRASLTGVLAAREAPVEVRRHTGTEGSAPPGRVAPLRPRARILPGPPPGLDARQRVLSLTGALLERTPPRTLVLEPAEAADHLLAQLRDWGYLP